MNKNDTSKSTLKKNHIRRSKTAIGALIAVGLLILLYVFALIAALLSIPNWDKLFAASLLATIGVPILLWIYIKIFQQTKKSDSDSDINA